MNQAIKHRVRALSGRTVSLKRQAGEEIVLARGKQPIAKIVPYHPVAPKRRFGALRGVVSVGPEFFDPLPDDELAAWDQ